MQSATSDDGGAKLHGGHNDATTVLRSLARALPYEIGKPPIRAILKSRERGLLSVQQITEHILYLVALLYCHNQIDSISLAVS